MSPSTPRHQPRMVNNKQPETKDLARKQLPLTKVFWTKDAEASLIEKVKGCQSLWDCRHPSYLKKTLRRKEYEHIASHMMDKHPQLGYLCSDHVRVKFSNMKTYYLREKKRMQSAESVSLVSPRWEWFEMLSFIDDCSEPGPSESNLQPGTIDEKIAIKEECVSPQLIVNNGLMERDSPLHEGRSWLPDTDEKKPLISAIQRHNLIDTSTEDISSDDEGEPPVKKRRVLRKKISSDVTAAAIQKLLSAIEQQQDYAYGLGIAVASCLRKFPFRKQLEISCKILNILNDEFKDGT